jgi:hypothetical protein
MCKVRLHQVVGMIETILPRHRRPVQPFEHGHVLKLNVREELLAPFAMRGAYSQTDQRRPDTAMVAVRSVYRKTGTEPNARF